MFQSVQVVADPLKIFVLIRTTKWDFLFLLYSVYRIYKGNIRVVMILR